MIQAERSLVVPLARTPTLATTSVRLLASMLAVSVCFVIDGGTLYWGAIVLGGGWAAFAVWAHLRGARHAQIELDPSGMSLPSRLSSKPTRILWSAVRFALVQEGKRHGMFRISVFGRWAARLLQVSDFPDIESFRSVHQYAKSRIAPDRFLDASSRTAFMPWVTISFVALLTGVFAYGLLGLHLPQSLKAVYLGAFQTQLFLEGDWFRVFSASFAHLQPLHFGLNLFIFAAICAEIEERIDHTFVAGLIGVSSLWAGIAIASLPIHHDITLGASGVCYGAMGSLIVLTYLAPDLAPPSFRLVAPWWISLMLVIDIIHSIVSPEISLSGHVGGLIGGTALTLAHVHARRRSPHGLRVALSALSAVAASALVLSFCGLIYAGLTTPPRVIAERLLASDIAADTALDVANFVSRDAAVPAPLLQRAFAVLSDPERPGKEKIANGAYGVLREDTLGRIAWRLDMLGEARAHGLDAYRRGEDVTPDERKRLLARLAVYESSARLPPFVPAAVLVRANTLCVLVPAGNPRQYIRAVVRQGVVHQGVVRQGVAGGTPAAARDADKVTGIVLGTVDPGETRCIPAEGVSASSRVALTASERALLTSDLVYRPVEIGAAALLPRGGSDGAK